MAPYPCWWVYKITTKYVLTGNAGFWSFEEKIQDMKAIVKLTIGGIPGTSL
ncbi:MAG: hypothetical protein IPP32_17635 [Bacteroidetes bacterium]|nr:hypothetical protein [Bacteroidota bacterium]